MTYLRSISTYLKTNGLYRNSQIVHNIHNNITERNSTFYQFVDTRFGHWEDGLSARAVIFALHIIQQRKAITTDQLDTSMLYNIELVK